MQADTRPPKKGSQKVWLVNILSALGVVFPYSDFLSPQLSLINMFFGADDLEPATQGDTGEKREVRKPENARNESSSKIDPDILQSYGRARSSNPTWHNVDVNQENMFVILVKVELNKAWIMGVSNTHSHFELNQVRPDATIIIVTPQSIWISVPSAKSNPLVLLFWSDKTTFHLAFAESQMITSLLFRL